MASKLVRDKIPEIIKKSNNVPITHIADDVEYWTRLKEKLLEEVNEFLEDNNQEELADIMEVLDSIIQYKNFSKEEIEKIKSEKRKKRGGFNNRIILDKIK